MPVDENFSGNVLHTHVGLIEMPTIAGGMILHTKVERLRFRWCMQAQDYTQDLPLSSMATSYPTDLVNVD